MINLIKAELYKFYHRRLMLLSFLSVPVLIGLSYKFFKQDNEKLLKMGLENIAPNFVSNITFPYLVVQEQLILIFSILIVFYVATIITEELKSGEIRMTLCRGYTLWQLILSKVILISGVFFVLFILCYVLSIISGNFLMPHKSYTYTFLTHIKMNLKTTIIYGIKFYALSYLITLAMTSLMIFFGVISKNKSIMTGIGLTIIFVGLAITNVIDWLKAYGLINKTSFMPYFIINNLQFSGAASILECNIEFKLALLLVVFLYIIIFMFLTFLYGKVSDYVN